MRKCFLKTATYIKKEVNDTLNMNNQRQSSVSSMGNRDGKVSGGPIKFTNFRKLILKKEVGSSKKSLNLVEKNEI